MKSGPNDPLAVQHLALARCPTEALGAEFLLAQVPRAQLPCSFDVNNLTFEMWKRNQAGDG